MKMTWIVLYLVATGASYAGTAYADFIGIDIGGGQWTSSFSDSLNSGNNSKSIVADDLGIKDDAQTSLTLTFEHPIPILPNIHYQGSAFDSSGSSTLESDRGINDETFNSDNRVRSDFDFSHNDIVLYYQLLDNWIDLNMGVDLKHFDGEVGLTGNTTTRVDVDETIPLLHLSARFNLPYNGFYIGANFNNRLGDSSVEDSTLKLGYESNSGLGFEGGIKMFSLELDDTDNLDTNLKYDGIFLNGYYNF